MAAAMQKEKSIPLSGQRLKARLLSLRQNPSLGGAALVALGTLFLLLAFPFYPLPVVPVLAAIAGAIAYRYAPLGTLVGMLLAMPAVVYQSAVFGWVYLLLIAITMFEMFEHWSIISFLQIVILAPFAPYPFSFLSGFTYLAMALAALYIGSKKSILVSIPAVYFVLLLSTIWMTQNSAFMPVLDPQSAYGPEMEALGHNRLPEAGFAEIFPSISGGFGRMLSESSQMMPAFGKIISNTSILLLQDSAILQLASWAAVLFAIGFLPGRSADRFKQTGAVLFLFAIPLVQYLISTIYPIPFEPLSLLYVLLSVGAIAILEYQYKVNFSREQKLMRKDWVRKFGAFGLESVDIGTEKLDDIGGYEDIKEELRTSVITISKRKDIQLAYGLSPPHGILLFGPPGTGKTMMMRALANEIGVRFIAVKCSELLSQWYGESEQHLSELFTIARKQAPALVFFDEIEWIGKKREEYSTDDIAPRILSLLLTELDGFTNRSDIIFVGATNAPHILDPALLRPGRFDKIIYLHLPDKGARESIFRIHLKKVPTEDDIDFARLAQLTERYSGADIRNICTEAVNLAAKEAMSKDVVVPIAMKHLTAVISKVRPSVSLDQIEDQEKFQLDFERRTGKLEQKDEEKEKPVRWSDVVGLQKVKETLLEAIEVPLLHEDLIAQFKIRPSKGLLLFGPPGCGKTMIVKAAAGELKATFLTLSGADLMKKGYTGAVRIIKESFNRAREQAPALIFIDEIEALAPEREIYGGNVVSQILTEMDGMRELKGVMLVGATNRPQMLDSAMLRPGRFDKIIYIPPPDLPARAEIFRQNLGDTGKSLDFAELARASEGFSGADIASICQEAKMSVVREKIKGREKSLSSGDILQVIRSRKPSVTRSSLAEFSRFLEEYGERK